MEIRKKHIVKLAVVALLAIFFVSSCSTKKNTWTRRTYHNINCHYNVYWNGMMSLQDGEDGLKKNVKDDYSKILRVYNYGDLKDAKRIYPKMDRTIKKASIGIQRHSMYFNGKENVKWIDDSYLMMGKAHFYKHDFISARRVFKYIANNFQDEPIHYEAYLWLAKTHIGAERYEKAIAAINLLQSKLDEEKFPLYVERQIPLVLADFYLAQEEYEDAYPYLERSLEVNKDKFLVTRAEFILGQINQMEGDNDLATKYFKSVVKRNPDYVMAFEAKMNMAETYASENGDSKGINKILNKMLKEARNEEFRDQIYYALAQVAKKDGNDTLTINYLRESVKTSVKNNTQKTKSSLEVGDMFFERAEYALAGAYYDTAVGALPREYPNYDEIKYKAGVLSNLVGQSLVIKEQDSLQTLARMDTTELFAIIDKKIEEYIIAEEEKREEEEALADGGTQFVDMGGKRNRDVSLGGGGWYFYNPSALSMGYSEFTKKWGNRKLEDNWRLTDKRQMMQNNDDGDIASDSTVADTTKFSSNPIDRSFYLAGIPNTPDKIEASDKLIIEAYNQLGSIYFMELRDTIPAQETYLEFQKRFPDNEYRLKSWHALYKIYLGQNNFSEAEYYKNLILTNYPKSTYAKVINNPNYFEELEEEIKKASELYMKAYNAFNNEKYYRVISYANRGLELYPEDTAVAPRFMYLRALSLGKVDTHDTLYAALVNLIETYPQSPVTPRAITLKTKLHLEYGLGGPVDTTSMAQGDGSGTGKNNEPSIYTLNANEVHFVMFVVDKEKVKVNALKIRLSDFNSKYFSLMRLKAKSLMLTKNQTIITVGNFKSKSEAMNYFSALQNDEYVLSGVDSKDYDLFPISTSNYPLFYRDKSVSTYKKFYEKYYKRD